ncbi:hypothetical protein Dimus_029441 [Dionaea muscipula]
MPSDEVCRRTKVPVLQRSEKAPDRRSNVLDRRSERTIDKWFDDSFLDRGSEKTPDRTSGASQARKEAKDKSHIQCFVCGQYDHYNTQCDQNPKARKYLRRGNHGDGYEDPIPMNHMVNATITEGDDQENPTLITICYNNNYANIRSLLGRLLEVACPFTQAFGLARSFTDLGPGGSSAHRAGSHHDRQKRLALYGGTLSASTISRRRAPPTSSTTSQSPTPVGASLSGVTFLHPMRLLQGIILCCCYLVWGLTQLDMISHHLRIRYMDS